MKRIFILCATLLLVASVASAQDESSSNLFQGKWTTSSTPALKASEYFFNNLVCKSLTINYITWSL